jgi:hypothetical protein
VVTFISKGKYKLKLNLFRFLTAILICGWALLPTKSAAQATEVMPQLSQLKEGNTLPTTLLRERSLVLISPGAISWQDLAKEVHPVFLKNNIDAIAYYQLEEVMAGPDAQKELLPLLLRRQFANVLILSQSRAGGMELTIAPFSKDAEFVRANATSWHLAFNSVDQLDDALKGALGSSSIASTNFLIPDFPAYFRAASIPSDKRFEVYNPDLKLDNLAIRMFPESDPSAAIKNARLEEIAKTYPYKYELVNAAISEDVLRRNGFQWILSYLRAPEGNLREILGYNQNTEPGGILVYKYYVRQLYAQEIYLGDTWDANANWEQAMKAYFQNLRNKGF